MIEKPKKTIGVLIDKMYAIKTQIDRCRAEEAQLSKRKTKLEEIIIKRMYKDGCTSVRAKSALASIKKTRHLSVKDRRKLEKWIQKNNAFDLFTNHINTKAYFDREAEGVKVPGIEVYPRTSLSLTKQKS